MSIDSDGVRSRARGPQLGAGTMLQATDIFAEEFIALVAECGEPDGAAD